MAINNPYAAYKQQTTTANPTSNGGVATQQATPTQAAPASRQQSTNNPYANYKQNAMNTASPGELTLKLYNGCLNFIKKGKKAIEENNIEERNTNITKAQNIIRELMVTLKTDTEVAKNMLTLYDFTLNRLVDANIKNDIEALTVAEEFVTDFRDTWKEVIKIDLQNRHGASERA